jgi:DNA-directed RNA polymerase beta subunit
MDNSSLDKMLQEIDNEIISPSQFEGAVWNVIEEYYKPSKGYQLVKHQIESFNDFILRKVEQIIEGFNPIEINHHYNPETEQFKYCITMVIENPTLMKPLIYEKDGSTKNMTPNDARLRNFTYSSAINVDLAITAKALDDNGDYVIETKKLNGVSLGKIPIMVKSNYCILKNKNIESNECKYDYGGYFIINGNEKVVISQDRISENKTFVFLNNKVSTYSHIAEIRSVQENRLGVPKITSIKLSAKPNQFGRYIRVNIHHIKTDIPLFILFKAFGLCNDKEIIEYIVYNIDSEIGTLIASQLMACVEEANQVMCQRDAIEYLAKYLNITGYPREYMANKINRINIVRNVLEKEVLPHVGKDLKKKALYLAYMVNKLIQCYLGLKEFDDRDSYINKRVDTPGVLLASIFRQYYGKMIKDMKNMIQKEINVGGWKVTNKLINVINKVNIYKIVKSTIIDSGLRYALSTGNWGIKSNKNKQGVAQVLNRMTYNATLSHLRRVNTPIEKSGKLVLPRKLHATQWGVICPAETPEGASVGLVKNMAMTANITICSNSVNIRSMIIEDLGVIPFCEETGYDVHMFHNNTRIVINGDIVGVHSEPHILYKRLKTLKQKGCINIYTGVVWNFQNNEISISTEGGRCIRPLFIVDNSAGYVRCRLTNTLWNKMKEGKMTWRELCTGSGSMDVHDSVIEYMDVEETNAAMIAMNYNEVIKKIVGKTDIGKITPSTYTNMEIHPSLIMGVLASCIPFSDHNQAPRVAYQCLWKEEDVLMATGERRKIKDVCVGDEVVTFDPKTYKLSTSQVINQYVKPTDKKINKITTFSGREIVATYDHPFMTNEGWKKVEEFTDTTEVGIQFNKVFYDNIVTDEIILSENDFINKLVNVNLPQTLIMTHVEQLKTLGLLPLKSTNDKLPVLSRMFGIICTDGSINVYTKKDGRTFPQCAADFGCKDDAEMFQNEVEYLGLTRVSIKFRSAEEYGSTYGFCHNGPLPSLFIALGATLGNHVKNKRKPVPQWIMNGSKLVKREFLSSFQGGDGCKIRWNKTNRGHNYICAMTSQQTIPEYTKELEMFFGQMVHLFKEFDIEISGPNVKVITPDRTEISYKIRDTHENLVKYYETIGYTYSTWKNAESGVVIEYLKFKERFIAKHKQLMTQVRELYDQGVPRPDIARRLNIKYSKVSDQIRYYNKGCDIACKFTPAQQIEHFLEQVHLINNTMFMKVKSVEEVPNCEIADITIECENHSFVGGDGFMVHNSSMAKQALGIYTSNYRHRYDTMGHVLNYAQRPLVKTNMSTILNNDDLPSGCTAIVAIATYTGFNQEDSVIMNKSSVDRGLFMSTYYRTYKELNNKNHSNGEEEFFTKPDTIAIKNVKPYNYDKLDATGFVPENTYVQSGDVIIGKVMPTKVESVIQYKDNSTTLKANETGYIDRNGANDKYFTNTNGDGYNFAKVRVRNDRIPTIGDKFSCYTQDHEVLTTEGWISIDKVTEKHKVASLVNGVLMYQNPSAIQEYDFEGDLYKVESNQVKLKVTGNHRMYVKTRSGPFRMELASEVSKRRRIYKKNVELYQPKLEDAPRELIIENNEITQFHIDTEFGEFICDIDDWLVFFGIWIAEGSTGKTNSITSFAAHKQRVKDALDICATNMNIQFKKIKDQTDDIENNCWYYSNKCISQYLRQLGTLSTNKHLPDWVWFLSKEQCKTLIHGMCLGDGHTMENGTRRYDTSSTQLADDFQRLCLHAGWSANKILKYAAGKTATKKNGYVITSNFDAFRLTITTKQNQPLVNKNMVLGKETTTSVDSWEYFKGKVYCCTVPEGDGIIYVRHQGYPVWCGNSRHGRTAIVKESKVLC